MSFQLRTVDRTKLYLSIVDQITEAIRTGAYPPGKALPAERVLAMQLGVSRGSLREATRVLEHAGVLDVRIGSGTYVTEVSSLKAAALRARTAVLGEPSPLDVMVARRAVEPVCASEAAANARSQDLKALRVALSEQSALTRENRDPMVVDMRFHVAVASATRNPVLLAVVRRLTEMMQEGRQELQHQSDKRPGTFERYLQQHTAIQTAIDSHEPEAAATAMITHLDTVVDELLSEVP